MVTGHLSCLLCELCSFERIILQSWLSTCKCKDQTVFPEVLYWQLDVTMKRDSVCPSRTDLQPCLLQLATAQLSCLSGPGDCAFSNPCSHEVITNIKMWLKPRRRAAGRWNSALRSILTSACVLAFCWGTVYLLFSSNCNIECTSASKPVPFWHSYCWGKRGHLSQEGVGREKKVIYIVLLVKINFKYGVNWLFNTVRTGARNFCRFAWTICSAARDE